MEGPVGHFQLRCSASNICVPQVTSVYRFLNARVSVSVIVMAGHGANLCPTIEAPGERFPRKAPCPCPSGNVRALRSFHACTLNTRCPAGGPRGHLVMSGARSCCLGLGSPTGCLVRSGQGRCCTRQYAGCPTMGSGPPKMSATPETRLSSSAGSPVTRPPRDLSGLRDSLSVLYGFEGKGISEPRPHVPLSEDTGSQGVLGPSFCFFSPTRAEVHVYTLLLCGFSRGVNRVPAGHRPSLGLRSHRLQETSCPHRSGCWILRLSGHVWPRAPLDPRHLGLLAGPTSTPLCAPGGLHLTSAHGLPRLLSSQFSDSQLLRGPTTPQTSPWPPLGRFALLHPRAGARWAPSPPLGPEPEHGFSGPPVSVGPAGSGRVLSSTVLPGARLPSGRPLQQAVLTGVRDDTTAPGEDREFTLK